MKINLVTKKCGHEKEIAYFSDISFLKKEIHFEESNECTACWEKRCEESAMKGDIKLKGTEKQVKWAHDIRNNFKVQAQEYKNRLVEKWTEKNENLLNAYLKKDEAQFWINKRFEGIILMFHVGYLSLDLTKHKL